MREMYWEQFLTSGRIEDYLNYKNSTAAGRDGEKQAEEDGDKPETEMPGGTQKGSREKEMG